MEISFAGLGSGWVLVRLILFGVSRRKQFLTILSLQKPLVFFPPFSFLKSFQILAHITTFFYFFSQISIFCS